MEFKEILNRKIEHYGKTEAAYEFAAEEYSNKLIKEAQAKQLILHNVSQQRELLRFMEWLSTYWGIDEVIDCTKHQNIVEQYKP